jgi:hypothetical protein
MQASIGDESRRAWDIAVFGADCFKADQKGQKCRKTRVFLHPIEPTNLCWLSQWKSNKDSLIDLLEVAVELPDRLEVFAKIGRQHFLVLKHPKKKLILSFDSKKEKEAFALVSSIIHSRKGVPR